MSDRNKIDRISYGQFGLGPKDVAQCFHAEVKAWRKVLEDCDDPERLGLRLDSLRDAADQLGRQYAGLIPTFDHHGFMRACGFDN